MSIVSVPLTGKPKQVILNMAFEDCGLGDWDTDRTPGEIASALRRLNAMMLEWPWSQLGYVQPIYGEGAAEDISNIPDDAVNVVAQALALRLSPAMAAPLSAEQRASMSRSIATFHGQYASIPSVAMPAGIPTGAGYRNRVPFSVIEE